MTDTKLKRFGPNGERQQSSPFHSVLFQFFFQEQEVAVLTICFILGFFFQEENKSIVVPPPSPSEVHNKRIISFVYASSQASTHYFITGF